MINNGWKADLQALRKMRDEYSKFSSIMTEFERAGALQEIESFSRIHGSAIQSSAIAEHDQALEGLKVAQKKLDQAHLEAGKRFDTAKLVAEKQLARMMVDDIQRSKDFLNTESKNEKLASLLQVATESGDIHKVRAMSEELLASGKLAGTAKRTLDDLNTTDAIKSAEANYAVQWNSYMQVREGLCEMHKVVNGSAPSLLFPSGATEKSLNRLQVLPGGRARIFDYSAPEIQNVTFNDKSGNLLEHA